MGVQHLLLNLPCYRKNLFLSTTVQVLRKDQIMWNTSHNLLKLRGIPLQSLTIFSEDQCMLNRLT